MSDILWCMHVRGPDDVYAAASYDDAVVKCDALNAAIARRVGNLWTSDVFAVAYPAEWMWTPEAHAANLVRQEEDAA